MKIIFNKEFKRKLSIVSIFFAEIFQLYIILTIADIVDNGFTESNVILLIFNVFYILALYFYNDKINQVFKLRGKYLSLKKEHMSTQEINEDSRKICKELFENIFDGDFRP